MGTAGEGEGKCVGLLVSESPLACSVFYLSFLCVCCLDLDGAKGGLNKGSCLLGLAARISKSHTLWQQKRDHSGSDPPRGDGR
jgi:hypothetical protein